MRQPVSISSARDFANSRIALVREKLERGETVYLAGLGPPGTHNSGVALVEVTQANGPRLIVNNEEERFSGNKHTIGISAAVDRRDGRRPCAAWDAISAISTPG